MLQVDGPAVNCHTNTQRTTVIAPFPITLVLVAIGAKALQIIGVALKVTVAVRAPNVIDLCCDPNVAAELAMLAKRPSAQGLRARDLAPVSRSVVRAVSIEGCAVTHVDLPVLARVVPAGGPAGSPLPGARVVAAGHHRRSRPPSDHRPGCARRSWADAARPGR